MLGSYLGFLASGGGPAECGHRICLAEGRPAAAVYEPPPVARSSVLADIDSQEHGHLHGSANLTLPASVVSRSRIRSVKQHQRTPLKMPQRDTANTHMPKTEKGQATFL
jgi:hypothetical protein